MVDVWRADLALLEPAHERHLSADDRRRRDGLLRADDRARLTLGVALARTAAAHLLGTDPGHIRLERRCPRCGAKHGKPRVVGGRAHVSVTHSGGLVAVAATRVAPVGLDLEPHASADAELAAIVDPGRAPAAPVEVARTWCRKESAVKATGDGLLVGLGDVLVTPPDQPPRLLGYPGRRVVASMHDLDLRGGYAAALTVLTDEAHVVRLQDGASLLTS